MLWKDTRRISKEETPLIWAVPPSCLVRGALHVHRVSATLSWRQTGSRTSGGIERPASDGTIRALTYSILGAGRLEGSCAAAPAPAPTARSTHRRSES